MELVLTAINGWVPMDQWTTGSKLFGIAILGVPFFLLVRMHPGEGEAVRNERIQKALKLDPNLRVPEAPSRRAQLAWVLGGGVLGLVLGTVILQDRALGRVIGASAFLILPYVGVVLGLWLSPQERAQREFQEGVTAALRRERETQEERYQRERVTENWPGAQTEWRKRVYDALVWWSSEGARLTSDSEFLLALVHQRGGAGIARPDDLLARYQDPNDPCSTWQRAEQVAAWATSNLADLIADHLPESRRSIAGVTEVLRHHHRREVVFHQEARAYALNAAVETRREESPEHLVERILKESDAVALAREKGMKRIGEVAATMRPEARDHYIRATTAGVNALLEAWLFARIDKVR
ncbi:MAG: hypothetical protein ACKO3S_12765 [bacterium]